ncbi:MAG: hypothetical protein KDJ19_02605 [Hyphomicrobiaceae bacterium]|nr:hypothetical protein [Hyphomicrobiaceae bacterium]MCC0025240.1 hypothetical protein [Hyphomicrobiaceae bacterium]
MDQKSKEALDESARTILKQNDRGGYTIPTKDLYPFQWNWDSSLVALGLSTFDLDRAWTELETLLSAQWDNGMVPHIVFWKDDEGYFPGPGEWGAQRTPPTSGITQPPVAATVARRLFAHPGNPDARRAVRLVETLDRWHQWFADARDPNGTGLVAIIHPWESGRDNLPDWDVPLSIVDTSGVGEYRRRDTEHVDASQRPQKADYDRYMALVQFGRDNAWDTDVIAHHSPFWVADVGMNAILRRAETDLAWLADAVGKPLIAARATARARQLEKGFERLWSEKLGGYVSLDLKTNQQASDLSAGSWLAFYAGSVHPARAEQMMQLLAKWQEKVRYSVPSFDPTNPLFDDIRYWRGPVWAIINWMISEGLTRNGYVQAADRIRTDTRALIADTGFFEYFSPLTAQGGGGDFFSWTASMWLSWATPLPDEIA